jgi:hypothetical protein
VVEDYELKARIVAALRGKICRQVSCKENAEEAGGAAYADRKEAWKPVWDCKAPKLNLYFLLVKVRGERKKLARTRTFPCLVCREFDPGREKVKWVLCGDGRIVRRAPASLNQQLHQTKVDQGWPTK